MSGKSKKGKHHKWITENGLKQLEAWARNGLTDDQIAKNMGVSRQTLYSYKNKFPELVKALEKGKEVVDIEVENALYKNAIGSFVEEEKTYISEVEGIRTVRKEVFKRYIKPDTTAQIFWLKNRKPDDWRDKPREDPGTTQEDKIANIFLNLDQVIKNETK